VAVEYFSIGHCVLKDFGFEPASVTRIKEHPLPIKEMTEM